MRRGGARRRWILPHEAAVCCPSGRWGRRRTRTTECWATLLVEDCYTALLRDDAAVVRPGASGELLWSLPGRTIAVTWEIRPNAVWRRGRVFLHCSQCGSRCTRLYVPTATSWAACRRCWGLTYQSRTQNNYKDSGGGAFGLVGMGHRFMAHIQTERARDRRREASVERWAERRDILTRKPRTAKRRRPQP